jgi:hypothetical protein
VYHAQINCKDVYKYITGASSFTCIWNLNPNEASYYMYFHVLVTRHGVWIDNWVYKHL